MRMNACVLAMLVGMLGAQAGAQKDSPDGVCTGGGADASEAFFDLVNNDRLFGDWRGVDPLGTALIQGDLGHSIGRHLDGRLTFHEKRGLR